MPIIGLTGGIGSGKSLAASQFASLGVPMVDTDAISHALTSKGMPIVAEIGALFGSDYLHADGTLNRTALRQLVFSNSDAKMRLEAILHPAIHAQAVSLLAQNAHHLQPSYQIIVVPLLFETNHYAHIINQALVIDCHTHLQIERVLARAGNTMSAADVQRIIDAQMNRQARLAKADLVIANNDSAEALFAQVRATHVLLTENCLKKA